MPKPPKLEQERRLDPQLETFDLEGVARYIADRGCKRIVVLCGAGISTSAGIPDFRTPGSGLYDNLQRFGLPTPESVFDLEFFRESPGAFYELVREMWPDKFDPTPCHYFIRMLHEKGLLLRCYSQNIDSLERRAGLPADKVIAAHGNFDGAHVIDTDPETEPESQDIDIEELKAAVDGGEEAIAKLTEWWGGLVKPKIVFFGEDLPERFTELREPDLASCDLLLVMGTSLVVGPFNKLVGMANPYAPRLLINREWAGLCDMLAKGFRFHKSANWRDAFHQSSVDDGVHDLANALGWGADLQALVDSKGSAAIERAPWAPVELDGEPVEAQPDFPAPEAGGGSEDEGSDDDAVRLVTMKLEMKAKRDELVKATRPTVETDAPAAAKYKAEVDATLATLGDEAASLTGKANKQKRMKVCQQAAALKATPQYIDACSVVKGMEPKHGFFMTGAS